MSNLYIFDVCENITIYKADSIEELMDYLRNNLDDLRSVFESISLTDCSLVEYLPEIYETNLNLYKDRDWKKAKKIIEKKIFRKYSAEEIFSEFHCNCNDGNIEPFVHVSVVKKDDIINVKNIY
ncbi:hypothetical protein QJ850_gp033 [Acanthamoeba polyphaga mimivirus]|uniref:Uncharacterized protein n=1 Tax=Acanthamoeba polyphaga mimivirus Kroon TaxID=3069720 RepID=A0A0G2Y7H2_9VIRU|nr:hypothetical protein QJ850_gp033 [Acanthamoeba polyphaga mimivirus]AKI79762.1 hypothetical protein [Acanthamoeba polyphaga mimivirus Kroon]